jgi:hypothetical protein
LHTIASGKHTALVWLGDNYLWRTVINASVRVCASFGKGGKGITDQGLLLIDDSAASRAKHAVLVPEQDALLVIELCTTNGVQYLPAGATEWLYQWLSLVSGLPRMCKILANPPAPRVFVGPAPARVPHRA